MRFQSIAIAATTNISLLTTITRASETHNNNLRAVKQQPQLQHRQLSGTVSYPPEEPYSTSLLNPERGFYTQLTYKASSPSRLDATSLARDRESKGESVILRLVYLDLFKDGPISQSVLEDIEADFGSMHAAGVKCVLRFAYTDVQGGTTDPTKSIVLNHISQLKAILTSNQDAILTMQAGFVGPWGEWHGSTNFDEDLEGRQAIVSALLDAVPERNVQIRTPLHKQTLYASVGAPTLVSSGHVADGGFEGSGVGTNWGGYHGGYTIDLTDFNEGSQSVKVTDGAAMQWVALTVNEGFIIEITGFSKRMGATGSAPSDYSIYADVAYLDNTYTWGEMAKFSGEDSWNKAVNVFPVPSGKTVIGMTVYCMYRNANEGYALFDDVAITVYELPSSTGAEAIEGSNAFDGSRIARTGHHNDCFLASDTDYRTYTAPYSHTHTEEYDYLEQETKYTSMGGETCVLNSPRSDCDKASEELELFHYTYLNSGYHQDVIDSWTTEGCMQEIAARLGYRFLLKTGSFGTSAAPGGSVPYSIQIENVGYASPVNSRPFQLVLRETTTGAICAASDASKDMREWFGGQAHAVEGNLVLPGDLPDGTYSIFLNLADGSESLRTDLNYKMKVANTGLNDEATGMIDLQYSVTVAAGESSAPSNSGPDIQVVCGMEQDVLPPVESPGPVKNGGFEGSLEVDWGSYMNGYTADQTFKHSGDQSIKITNGGARQSISLNAEAGSQVTIKGYSKAVGTSTGLWDYGIYADVAYSDGSYHWGLIATFPGGTHDFKLGQKTLEVPFGKTVTGMTVFAMYRNDPIADGVAYFDDVEVNVEAPNR